MFSWLNWFGLLREFSKLVAVFCFNTYHLWIDEAHPLVDSVGRAPVHGMPWFLAYSKLFSYGLETPRAAWLNRTSLVKESMKNISLKMLFHCCFLCMLFLRNLVPVWYYWLLNYFMFCLESLRHFCFLLIFHGWHFYKGISWNSYSCLCGMVFSL